MDAKSNPLSLYPSVYSAPTSGFNLQLTIDGDIQDIVDVFKKTNCDGALAASLFHYVLHTLP